MNFYRTSHFRFTQLKDSPSWALPSPDYILVSNREQIPFLRKLNKNFELIQCAPHNGELGSSLSDFSEILFKNSHLHLVTSELVLPQPGSSLGRRTWHHHHRLVAILLKEILTYYMIASKVINTWQSRQTHRKLGFGIFHTTLQGELGWSMVFQLKLS